MNKCKCYNKRIGLSKNRCMKCLEKMVNNLNNNKEKLLKYYNDKVKEYEKHLDEIRLNNFILQLHKKY